MQIYISHIIIQYHCLYFKNTVQNHILDFLDVTAETCLR